MPAAQQAPQQVVLTGQSRLCRALRALEVPALVAVPAALMACAYFQVQQAAAATMAVVALCLVVFFAGFEASRPALRQIMPAVVLGALAAAGRLLFFAVPSFKPVAAICIISGVVFGRRTGFLVGALAALVSNFFLSQGLWTPWQMYAWGLIGYMAGVLACRGLFERRLGKLKLSPWLYVFAALSGLLYGWLLNTWYAISFVQPFSPAALVAAYAAGLPFDAVQSGATVVFLLVLYEPWKVKLERIRTKYDLRT
ncbi:MAG: ECF transporter S component [Coriobacteriia bacterium]|nr:ECF transporter S component [Coriobacteriia bacterium]